MGEITVEQRLDRMESRIAIGELPCRYARAVDARDIDAWVGLFIEDVNCGRYGTGREALAGFITPLVKGFYRSIHYVCGHVVDFDSDDRAHGTVYCRAEHEDGDKWVVMGIVYFDDYVRRDGQWFFERRREKHWYSVDREDHLRPPFSLWPGKEHELPALPHCFESWDQFWADTAPEALGKITRQP